MHVLSKKIYLHVYSKVLLTMLSKVLLPILWELGVSKGISSDKGQSKYTLLIGFKTALTGLKSSSIHFTQINHWNQQTITW